MTQRNRPARLGRESALNPRNESDSLVGKVFDFTNQSDCRHYIEALLISRLLAPDDGETQRLERAMFHQSDGAMHNLIAANREAYEAFDQQASVLLEKLKSDLVL